MESVNSYSDFVTLPRHIISQLDTCRGNVSCGLACVLQEIAVATKIIRSKVSLAKLVKMVGSAETMNVQGETQQILDRFSDEIMRTRLMTCLHIQAIISEENDNIVFSPHRSSGEYVVAMDPLDGSSNIDCSAPIGTIFGIWRVQNAGNNALDLSLLAGNRQVAAGYVLYGSSCLFVYSMGHGVNGFTYDETVGEFFLTHENIRLPPYSRNYSINEAYYSKWDDCIRNIVSWIKTPDSDTHRPYAGRYVGSLIADFHRNLLYGGIYLYPPDRGQKCGKLRLMYEAAPLTFIIEQAGGMGSDGYRNILDIVPDNIHQRVALYIGLRSDVEMCQDFINGRRS